MDKETYKWLNGECGSYAYALQDAAFEDGVELQLGINRNSSGGVEHVFAYLNNTAYDALGAHPMPYHPEPGWTCETEIPDDLNLGYADELIEEAFPHALAIWEGQK